MNFTPDTDLGKVANAYAADCVDFFATKFSVRLDYSAASVTIVERYLELFHAQRANAPEVARIEQFSKIFGSYLGETYRRLHGGRWGLDESSQPALRSRGGLVCYPWARAYKRIVNGKEENVAHWFEYLAENDGGLPQPLQSTTPPRPPTPPAPAARTGSPRPQTRFVSSAKAQELSGARGPFGLFGTFYTLSITVIIDESHSLEKEIRIINEHYVNWLNRHDQKCHNLVLGFTAPPDSEDAILSQCRRLLMQELGHEKALAAMKIDVVIVNVETEESKEYQLKWDPNAQPPQETPPASGMAQPAILGIGGPTKGQQTLLIRLKYRGFFSSAFREQVSAIWICHLRAYARQYRKEFRSREDLMQFCAGCHRGTQHALLKSASPAISVQRCVSDPRPLDQGRCLA